VGLWEGGGLNQGYELFLYRVWVLALYVCVCCNCMYESSHILSVGQIFIMPILTIPVGGCAVLYWGRRMVHFARV